jgi:hypothetical protein
MPPTTTSTCCMPASRSASSSAGTSDLQLRDSGKLKAQSLSYDISFAILESRSASSSAGTNDLRREMHSVVLLRQRHPHPLHCYRGQR